MMPDKPSYAELEARIAALEAKVAERRQSDLLHSLPIGMALYEAVEEGKDFVFVDFNEAGARIEGVPAEAAIGRRVTEVFPGVEEFGLLDVFRRVWKTGQPEAQPVSLYQDERLAGWRENHVFKLPSGRIVSFYQDLTERKRAEEALRISEQHLRIHNAIADCFLTLEGDDLYHQILTVCLDALESTHGVLGYVDEDDSLVCQTLRRDDSGKHPGKDMVFPQKTWRGLWGQALSEERILFSNLDLQLPPGHIPIHNALAAPILLAGRPIGLIMVGNKSDDYLPEDVQLIESIASHFAPVLSSRLMRDRQERARAALEEQLRQAQRMEAVGQLAGGMAHDFNNLLSVINNYTAFAIEKLDESNPIRSDLVEVQKAGERAATLTRKLLTFSRRQHLEPAVVHINRIIRDIEEMLRRLLGEDLDIELHLSDELDHVEADAGQIEQVIMNLVLNARDAMQGGGRLSIETRNAELDEYYAASHIDVRPGRYICLTVTDSGCGMDEQVRSRAFEPFFTTKASKGGTGLGLSTVYGIVKQSGGHIWLYSELGRGSAFKVYLPAIDAPAPERNLPHKPPPGAGGETVLVVEDEDAVRELACRILRKEGYRTLTAASGAQAVQLCEQHAGDIDLLLTDVVMPKMSGKQLADSLSASQPGLKVLYMSGYTEDTIRGAGGNRLHFISKPFSASELTQKVRTVLDENVKPPG
ncbi:MAG: response regulator [Deltaproteobacteria bacterium]|nr:response regulator [Deltaproteobacteria bacterium]